MLDSNELLFFTYADGSYEYFALPYAFSALKYNPNAKVEIVLENYDDFLKKNRIGINVLEEFFPGQVLFRQSIVAKCGNSIPNTIRFIEQPLTVCRYIYIGDIDLLVLEDVVNVWRNLMDKYNLPFGNAKRRNDSHKLTGLHFVEYNNYYPLPNISDINLLTENDESVLFKIMERKGLMVPDGFHIRPLCGLHMSLSRDPWGRFSGPSKGEYKTPGLPWMLPEEIKIYTEAFLMLLSDSNFMKLYSFFDYKFKCLLLVAEGYVKSEERTLHCFASSYMVDKRLLVNEKNLDIKVAKKLYKHKAKISYEEASNFLLKMHAIWPKNISIHLMCFKHFIDEDPERAAEFGLLMTDFEDGIKYWCENMNLVELTLKLEKAGLSGKKLLYNFEHLYQRSRFQDGFVD